MRKLFLSILLATTAATPALAARPSAEERAAAREERKAERSQARESRSEAREQRQQARPQRVERSQRVQSPQRAQQSPARSFGVRDRTAAQRPANVNERGRPTLQQRQVHRNSVADWRSDRRESAAQQRQVTRDSLADRREQRQLLRQERQESRDRWVDAARSGRRLPPPPGARPDRPAPAPATGYHSSPAPTWHGDWRRDHRYDWRDHRRHHRSLFHLGFYFDPFGWGYQRWGIGWRLWPSYYNSSYWLNDPWMYRLPYAPWPYKWIRYYDDAILVNTYTGEVVDVIYDFFW